MARINRCISHCKSIVTHFKKSTKEMYKLREKQKMLELPSHELVQNCVTRWGSTLVMLEHLMEQQAAIAAVLLDAKHRHLPDSEDWTLIEQLVSVLKPFQLAIETMSVAKFPSISTIQPPDDSAAIISLKKATENDLNSRYNSSEVKELIDVAMFLDPRYKELPFYDTTTRLEIADNLQRLLTSIIDADKEEASSPSCSQTSQPLQGPPAKKKKGSTTPMEQLFGDIFSKESSVDESRSSMFREVALYKSETAAKLDSDPLEWWKR